jgi:ribosomal protein S18 acetylase RimI-like enzyme
VIVERHTYAFETDCQFAPLADSGRVGRFRLVMPSCRDAWKKEGKLYLCNFMVYPEYQGRGFGKQMSVDAIDEGKRLGAKAIWLRVFTTNVIAHRVYLRAGFVFAEPRSDIERNNLHVMLLMEKTLAH